MSERFPFMKKLSRATPSEVAERWREQYFERNGKQWGSTISGPAQTTYNKIKRAHSSDKVDEIIGNKGWTRHHCQGCGEESDEAVCWDRGSDYDSVTLCRSCIIAARKFFIKRLRSKGD